MIILGIETSCDETGISIIDAKGTLKKPSIKVLGNSLFSQIDIHKEYGGVFPMLAKREHGKNLVPLLKKTLKEANLLKNETRPLLKSTQIKLEKILLREPELLKLFLKNIPIIKKPNIDAIAVTSGPGLEPALWVGIVFAKALSLYWNIPVFPINHMEGHIFSVMFGEKNTKLLPFPLLALLISGGHTELVLSQNIGKYKILGKTRDDAVGEAFDKVARILDLPYPGGPQISALAKNSRKDKNFKPVWNLPRPMMYSKDFDFSFSGLKTSVLYKTRELKRKLNKKEKETLAREFEDTVVDVLISKTKKALEYINKQKNKSKIKTLVVAGGVIANTLIRKSFERLAKEENISLYIPEKSLSTDNALMIAIAGFVNLKQNKRLLKIRQKNIVAKGNLSL